MTYVDVTVWGKVAENCGQYLTKGRPIFVEGRLVLDTWEDRATGQKRSRLRVRADRVQFLYSVNIAQRRDIATGMPMPPPQYVAGPLSPSQHHAAPSVPPPHDGSDVEDLPF